MSTSTNIVNSYLYSDAAEFLLGENVVKNDLLTVDEITSKAYKVKYLNYAAKGNLTYGTAQTSEATGILFTEVNLGGSGTVDSDRGGMILNSANDHIFVTSSVTTSGLKIQKFSKTGELRRTATAVAAGTTVKTVELLELSNGNMVLFYSTDDPRFTIYDENLTVVKSDTLAGSASSDFSAICTLASGGFSIVYQDQSNSLLSKLVTYDNDGNVTTAAITIVTRTGTTSQQYHKLKQLSNGNLLLVFMSENTVSSAGLHYGIFTSTGGVILSAVNIFTNITSSGFPSISVLNGFFCIAKNASGAGSATAGLYAYVYNNAGALQGANYYNATTANDSTKKISLVNDGTAFYLLFSETSTSTFRITKMPTTGTGYVSYDITLSTTNYGFYVTAFYENNAIVIATNPGAGVVNPQISVFRTDTLKLVSVSGTTAGQGSGYTTIDDEMRLLPLGERSFLLFYQGSSTAWVGLVAGKYGRTAILGVSKSTKNSGDFVGVSMLPGTYRINLIGQGSSLSAAFDMSANAFRGSKGFVNGYVVYLQGLATV